MTKQWWKEAVVYQIYPRSFKDSNGDGIGDIRGVISKLDYLKNLGIDVAWLSPVYKSPNDDNGYDISDYQDIMDEFGTMQDFDELLSEAHKRGIKIVMDLILNHTSDEHKWFVESRKSKDNPYRDYYIWRDGKGGKEPNNWESIFHGSAWEYDEATDQYYLHLFSKKQPDLNMENPVVRDELVKMIRWWLDKGIDGFRIDAITHIKKLPGYPDLPNPEGKRYVPSFAAHMNIPGIHTFLQEFKDRAFSQYDIMTVGEANGAPIEEAEEFVGEEKGKFNMLFHFEHVNADFGPRGRWDCAKVKIPELKKIMTKWQKGLQGKGWNALYLENHDQPRSVSRFGDTKRYHNESAKLLAVFYIMMQGTPFIYQGQEIGMTNVHFDSIDDYRDVEIHNFYRECMIDGLDEEDTLNRIRYRARDNARTPMQWNGSHQAGFTTGTPWIKVNPNYVSINVVQQLADPDSILNFYKKLIQLRKENEVAIYGSYDLVEVGQDEVFAYIRTLGDKQWIILCNFTEQTMDFTLPEKEYNQRELLLSNYSGGDSQQENKLSLRPFETRIYRKK